MTSVDGCCGMSTFCLISADGATPTLPLDLGGEYRESGREKGGGERRREGGGGGKERGG